MKNQKKIYILYPNEKGTIAPEIYGQFTEHIGGVIYDGIWVGKNSKIPNVKGFRKDIVEKLKAINVPVIRWPGGCFAETYDWQDGIGENRPTRVNFWVRCDGKTESNQVGTHEFMDFCEAVGADAYFAANITSTTPLHIRDWMDYCLSPKGSTTFALEREKNGHPEPYDIKYWGVGNENWGAGGDMDPDYYANEFRKFSTLMHFFLEKKGERKEELIACGSNAFDFNWTDNVMRNLRSAYYKVMNGFAIHYYCFTKGDPLAFTDEEWTELLAEGAKIEDIIIRNWNIICGYGMENYAKLVVDEWGCWHPDGSGPSKGEYLFEQQVTMRDAMFTALTLNIFNNHCDKVRMANAAQLVNCLQSLFLSNGENCVTTPTYHVFDMYKEHQGAKSIMTTVTNNDEFSSSVTVSASVKNGKTLLTIGNLSCCEDVEISLETVGESIKNLSKATLLYSDDIHSHNTFENPDNIVPEEIDINLEKPFVLPKASILSIEFYNM